MQPLMKRILFTCLLLPAFQFALYAQTDLDAIMMAKKNFCIGGTYSQNSWNKYWEGTFKRDNQNIGNVSTNMYSVMGNYGITDKLNFLFGVPYITTKAFAGTLHNSRGIQDFSAWLKWMPIEKKI